jgi:hypothetical protein
MAAGLGSDIIDHIVGYLDVQDAVSVSFADISAAWTYAARRQALPGVAGCNLTLETAYPYDGEETSDFEHLYPVIQRMPANEQVLPNRCIIFEPKAEPAFRHYTYSRNHFKPADVTLRCPDGKVSRWSLIPDATTREGNFMDVPPNNLYKIGPGDRFLVFCYFHEEDHGMREFPTKVFYKTFQNQIKLHCVSLPTGLFALLRENA